MALQSDEKQDNIVGADAWVVVGTAGTGKSSFINLFSSKHAQVSKNAHSCTKKVTAYPSKYPNKNGKKFVLIDTIGNEDTEGITDEEIFISILRFIHEHGLNSVIIFWFINQTIRATSTLQTQAKFIDAFREFKIWDSTIMIIKEATPVQVKRKSVAACEAVLKTVGGHGDDADADDDDIKNNIDEIVQLMPKIGYRCIDWLDDDAKEELNETVDIEKQGKLNILDENGVRKLIENAVKDIKGCQVIFMTDKCIKCGEIGDRRILSPKCHFGNIARKIHPSLQLNEFTHLDNNIYYKHKVLIPILKHKNEILITKYKHIGSLEKEEIIKVEYYHTSELETYHSGYAKPWHSGNSKKFHNGKFISYHSAPPTPCHLGDVEYSHTGSQIRYHDGHCNVPYHSEDVERYHPGSYTNNAGSRVLTGILTLGISEIGRRGYWTCCDGRHGDAGCERRYSCCKGSTNSSGCKYRWTCCYTTSGSSGCKSKYECCNKSIGSRGCEGIQTCCQAKVFDGNIAGSPCAIRYLCCNASNKDDDKKLYENGCKQKWDCCENSSKNSLGCKYNWDCCDSEVIGKGSKYSTNGCIQKCSKCDQFWEDKENGCDTQYSCCKGSSQHNGCKNREITIYGDYLYTCCSGNNESQGCYSEQFYQCCNKLIGTNGCGTYYTCCNKFKFEDINQGCVEYYKCCNSTTNSDMANGCVLKCCNEKRLNLNEKSGCTDVCSKCDGLWNDPNCKGCGIGKDYQHQVVPVN